jgi:outer membrane protein assembly factor BamA
LDKLNYRRKVSNKVEARQEIAKIINTLQQMSYLLARADSIREDSNSVQVHITPGKSYRLAWLKPGNLDPALASKLGISEKLYFDKPFSYRQIAASFEKIIVYYENNGYPFASVIIDSLQADSNSLRGIIHVERDRLFKLDSVKVNGTAKVNNGFLLRYLSLREGMPYDESAIRDIPRRIRQLPFISEKQPQVMRLTDRYNKLYLFLDKKNASQFDGILGVLPDASTGKTIITGDLKLKMVNGIFRNGETVDIEWRRLRSLTQDFAGRFIYPYLFKTPFGTDYALKIYRRDTTFIDVQNSIGIQYYFNGLNNIRLFYRQRNTDLISTSGYEFISTLPEYADITTQSYGVGITYERLDYRFNPRHGFSLAANIQTGNRIIRKNAAINEQAYQDVQLRSVQNQYDAVMNWFINLYQAHVLRIGIQTASIFGNSRIFRNELFRIGGLKTLRGFDEESIFTSSYVIPTIEYRFLFARNSNLLVFTEGAWYENVGNGLYVHDTPMSFGAGINLETKAGILNLTYSLGNQFNNGFDIRSGKLHVGLTALF